MARKQQRPKDMDPALNFQQYAMPPFPFNPYPAFGGGMPYVNPNGAPFVVHPFASSTDLPKPYAVAKKDHRDGIIGGPGSWDAGKAPNDIDSMLSAAERLCTAARNIYEQSKESFEVYQGLKGYNNDVKQVQKYVDKSILQQIWAKKVEKYHNNETGKPQRKQLSNQQEYLTELFDELDAAAQDLLHKLPRSHHQYDSRKTALDQLRQAGDRVRESSGKASTSKEAWDDLVKDLESITTMTDPKESAIYRFEKPEVDSQDQEGSHDDHDDE
ncbi:hypothetical protein PG993_014599 [Apiospora rasikravindrae]|uniref:Uncharacterized protein n=1 Tax=Apiospora rasikravindrae TaxID=990691 RepID=A0ABR1RN67_9PEZI